MKLFLFAIFLWSSLSLTLQQSQTDTDVEWKSFKTTHRKTYESTEEEELRKQIFLENLDKVTKHNELFLQGWAKYEMSVGGTYADLSFKEFKELRTGFDPSETLPKNNTIQAKLPQSDEVKKLPKNYDWRTFGYITPVRDQGKCGACWIFSALALIEAQLNIFSISINNLHLSEQQMLDCARTTELKGCNGGDPIVLIDYLKRKMAGVTGYNNYRPYEAEQATCKRRIIAENFYMADSGYYKEDIPAEFMMQMATFFMGPMVVGVSITENFIKYKSGIFNVDPLCTPNLPMDHTMLVVGFGETTDGVKFWILKNSWGTQWGEKGYMRMLRGTGLCKIGYYFGVAFIN